MSTRIAASEAKAVLGSLVREAEAGRVVELTRYSKPVAVLISSEQYARYLRWVMSDDSGND